MKKSTQPRSKKRSSKPRLRNKFPVISEEMKQWSAMLQGELSSWPAITTKSMFGFAFFYRRGVVFAGLPRTRGFDSPSALIFKLPRVHADLRKRVEGDARIGVSMKASSKGWFSFELRSEGDLRDALFWLQHACEGARK
jgi:hypothetical protein